MTTTTRAEWLAQRETGIGGSDAAAVAGFDPYSGPEDVWDEKVLGSKDRPDTSDTLRGRHLEPVAVEVFKEQTELHVRRQPLRRHKKYPWMIGNVDRQIIGVPDRGPGILEVKVPRTPKFYEIKAEGVPEPIIIQMQHYLEVYGYEWGFFCIFNPEYWELIRFEIVPDPALIEWLVATERRFWEEHVLTKIRPRRKSYDGPPIPKVPGKALVRRDDEWLGATQDYALAEYHMMEAQAEVDNALARLVDLAGDEQHVTGGCVTLKKRIRSGQRRWDKKAFIAALELARRSGEPEQLMELDPDDERFYYQTAPSQKWEPTVTDRGIIEVMQ